jgi:cytochrome c553
MKPNQLARTFRAHSLHAVAVIAGIPREQFITAFGECRGGVPKAAVMHRHAKGCSEQEIALLADYFSAQKR